MPEIINLKVPLGLKEEIEEASKKLMITNASLIRLAIRKYLDNLKVENGC